MARLAPHDKALLPDRDSQPPPPRFVCFLSVLIKALLVRPARSGCGFKNEEKKPTKTPIYLLTNRCDGDFQGAHSQLGSARPQSHPIFPPNHHHANVLLLKVDCFFVGALGQRCSSWCAPLLTAPSPPTHTHTPRFIWFPCCGRGG